MIHQEKKFSYKLFHYQRNERIIYITYFGEAIL
uniref:Uncharacterized protein n=1 Tax=Arundo donax TaxID=35708 RepID=A0A0A8ZJ05_ARUDO